MTEFVKNQLQLLLGMNLGYFKFTLAVSFLLLKITYFN